METGKYRSSLVVDINLNSKLYFAYSTIKGLDAPEPPNSPYSLTYHVGRMLREHAADCGYAFEYVNLDSTEPRKFHKADVVIGHVWDSPGSFMQQALQANVRAKIVLQPYSTYMVSEGDVPRYLQMFQQADALLFVTGKPWYDIMEQSPYAALKPKVTRLDMAVDSLRHAYRKTHWNAPGKRGWLCIGADIPAKGLDYVAELARTAGLRLAHVGSPSPVTFQHVPVFTQYPGMEFDEQSVTTLCQDYDFFLSLARADANPTTLLETAAWGLVGLCNEESGYFADDPFIGLNGTLVDNWETVDYWQHAPEWELKQRSLRLRRIVEREYTWERFNATVWSEVQKWL